MTAKLDDSWDRYPDAKVRLTGEPQLKALVDGLSKNGMMLFYKGDVSLQEDSKGVYVSLSISAGKYPDMLPVSIDVFIPVPPAMMPKPGKTLEEINEAYKKDLASINASSITIADDRTIHELKSTQMDVVGDDGRSSGDSGVLGGGTSDRPELSESKKSSQDVGPEV